MVELTTTDAGALLLGEADRAIRLTARFAACFSDVRTPGTGGRRSRHAGAGTGGTWQVGSRATVTSTTPTNPRDDLVLAALAGGSLQRSARIARRWRASHAGSAGVEPPWIRRAITR